MLGNPGMPVLHSVMSFHAASAVSLAGNALRRSAGSSCTTPPETRELPMVATISDLGSAAKGYVAQPHGRLR